MIDTARQFIDDTMKQLAVWRGDLQGRYRVGRKHWESQQKPPFIWWKYGQIDHDTADNYGWTDKAIASEEQALDIKIWCQVEGGEEEQASEDLCRVLKNDLFRALRVAADGPNINYGVFRFTTEEADIAGHTVGGAMLTGQVIVRLPVREDPSTLPTQFASITGATVTVKTGPQVTQHPDEETQETIVIPEV